MKSDSREKKNFYVYTRVYGLVIMMIKGYINNHDTRECYNSINCYNKISASAIFPFLQYSFCLISAAMSDVAVQVDLSDIKEDDEISSSGVGTASITEKTESEVCDAGSVENRISQQRTYNYSLESRNFNTPQTTRDGSIAVRLASLSLPSPVLDRRTIL